MKTIFIFLSLYFVLSFTLTSRAEAASFSQGDHFQAFSKRGNVTVYCPNQYAYFRCFDNYLSPANRDYFVYENAPMADRVELKAYQYDGRTQTKTERFQEGRTESSVNLWINTLFQRPLLNYGNNRISYKMTHQGEVTEEGEFDVYVERMPLLTCTHRTYWSPSAWDCSPQAANNVCMRYFLESRNCY